MNNISNTKYDFHGKTILLAEDDPLAVRIVSVYLQDTGAELLTVNNGIDAVITTNKKSIDLVLMDISMPGMDGYAATQNIRSFNTTVPILMYTASGGQYDRPQWKDQGFNDRLLKPVSKEAVLDMIQKYL